MADETNTDLSYLLKDIQQMENQNFAKAVQFNPAEFQTEMELHSNNGEPSK